MSRAAGLLVALLAWVACSAEPAPNPVKDAFTAARFTPGIGEAVVFRFLERSGSRPTMFRLPTLEAGSLRAETQPGQLRAVMGFVPDRETIYLVTADDELVALDLTTARFRVVDSNVVNGTIGPTGTPFVIHSDGSIATIGLKSVSPWPTGFDYVPDEVFGAVRERLLAVMVGDSIRRLVLAANGQPVIDQPVPRGKLHVSAWGDAALVATDSGLVLLDPADPTERDFVPLDPAPVDADFSASGHRIHVIRQDGVLATIDRFSRETVRTLELGAIPRFWRRDPWGRYILFKHDADAPIRVIDAVTLTAIDSIDGEWDEQLPQTAPDGSVLVRRGERMAAWTPGGGGVVAEIDAPASAVWLLASWDAGSTRETVVDEGEPESTAPGQELFVQVSTTTNADWAADLAANLRRAGMPASVLGPEQPLDPYRVVLGPYGTRDEAEATGRELRLPFWIFTRDTSAAEPE
jgi:hypothetical protein